MPALPVSHTWPALVRPRARLPPITPLRLTGKFVAHVGRLQSPCSIAPLLGIEPPRFEAANGTTSHIAQGRKEAVGHSAGVGRTSCVRGKVREGSGVVVPRPWPAYMVAVCLRDICCVITAVDREMLKENLRPCFFTPYFGHASPAVAAKRV
jgi:hypothetical protein